MFDEKIEQMLKRYELNTIQDHENALKEIIQEVVLLGLWRSKFYEKDAFYGGLELLLKKKTRKMKAGLIRPSSQQIHGFIL